MADKFTLSIEARKVKKERPRRVNRSQPRRIKQGVHQHVITLKGLIAK